MKLFIGDEIVNFTKEDLDCLYINSGNEANIYYYNGKILKLYKNSSKKVLSEEEVLELSQIETKRFLLPEEPLYDFKKNFVGYSRKYVPDYYKKIIGKSNISNFIDELSYMQEDIDNLSENKIDIEDLNIDNMLVGEGIYISDPGSFIKMEELRINQVHANNLTTFNNFVVNELIPMCTNLSKKECSNLSQYLKQEENISDFISLFIKDKKENVNYFMKRLSMTLSK